MIPWSGGCESARPSARTLGRGRAPGDPQNDVDRRVEPTRRQAAERLVLAAAHCRARHVLKCGAAGRNADREAAVADRRAQSGRWLKPERLAEPVNSAFAEWFPRPAADGWLYFGSRRPGGLGQDDIWKAKLNPQGRWTVENAGPEINSPDAEYEFLPSPDGGWALLSTNKGIYHLEHSPGGWTKRLLVGKEVNANGTEIGPTLFGRDGSFLFSRDTGSRESGELFIAYRGTRPSTISRGCFLFQPSRDGSFPH